MSARSPITLPDPFWRPRMTPTTPVRPIPVTTSSQPNSFSFSATIPAVRWTSKSSSGFSWKSRRQAAISSARSATRLMIGMLANLLILSAEDPPRTAAQGASEADRS